MGERGGPGGERGEGEWAKESGLFLELPGGRGPAVRGRVSSGKALMKMEKDEKDT